MRVLWYIINVGIYLIHRYKNKLTSLKLFNYIFGENEPVRLSQMVQLKSAYRKDIIMKKTMANSEVRSGFIGIRGTSNLVNKKGLRSPGCT